MTPRELKSYLTDLAREEIRLSVMMWGAPGIGKSSVVAQVAEAQGLELVDLRLSQLAPTDLRGLPVPDEGVSRWYPPEFLPQEGRGILFMDELNMAPPTLQGIAQQLILDREIGSYAVPDGWFIWSAGNRKEDRASVFDMPAPLANRFIHLDVEPHLESFRQYASSRSLREEILAFLAFRPELLCKLSSEAPAWPSPRSWEMASRLYEADLDVAPAIGNGTAGEFYAFTQIYETLPKLRRVLEGDGDDIDFPGEPSERYAAVVGLGARAKDAEETVEGFRWLLERAPDEFTQLFASDVFTRMREKGEMGALAQLAQENPRLKDFAEDMQSLTAPLAEDDFESSSSSSTVTP